MVSTYPAIARGVAGRRKRQRSIALAHARRKWEIWELWELCIRSLDTQGFFTSHKSSNTSHTSHKQREFIKLFPFFLAPHRVAPPKFSRVFGLYLDRAAGSKINRVGKIPLLFRARVKSLAKALNPAPACLFSPAAPPGRESLLSLFRAEREFNSR